MDNQRLVGIVGAVVVAVVAIVIALSSGGDDEDQQTGSAEPVATQTTTEDTTSETTTGEETTTEEAPPKPEVTEIEVGGGKPKDEEARIEVEKGDTIRFTVTTEDTTGHVHFHGYDILRDLAPGRPARFRVKAKLEGIFEVELEDTRTQIAEVRVEP